MNAIIPEEKKIPIFIQVMLCYHEQQSMMMMISDDVVYSVRFQRHHYDDSDEND